MSKKAAVKIIALLKRKPGLTMEAFIHYYENNHAPLVLNIAPFIMDYRRNYARSGSALGSLDGGAPDCDVITEAWFATKEDFDKFNTEAVKPENRDAIIRDELNFLDRGSMRLFIVEERESQISARIGASS
jgi:uncharacterized protein (TIGR02118 family)